MSSVIFNFGRGETLVSFDPHRACEIITPPSSHWRIEAKSDGHSTPPPDRNERGRDVYLIDVKSILGKPIFGHKKYIILRGTEC